LKNICLYDFITFYYLPAKTRIKSGSFYIILDTESDLMKQSDWSPGRDSTELMKWNLPELFME